MVTPADPWPMARVTYVKEASDAHRDDEPNVFIQWKGTNVCFDFWCPCGGRGHFDGYFAYCFKCPECGKMFEMPSTIIPAEIENSAWHNPVELEAG